MSSFKTQPPVIHIPSFNKWRIDGAAMSSYLIRFGVKAPMGLLDRWYYMTDLEGWGKILRDLVFKSSLYKEDEFDCENYALKAMNECAERYSLNTLALIIGDTPAGRHGFNMFFYNANGDVKAMLWEPNDGFPFSGSAFELNEYGYKPDLALI